MNSNSGKCEVRNVKCGICSALRAPHSALVARRAFTLTELLIVIAIIGIITGLGLSAMAGAVELAREQRTRSIIAKIDQLIMERYESYRTRAVPIRALNRQAAFTNPKLGATNRLDGVRALMRMELPDRRHDIVNYSTSPPSPQGTGVAAMPAIASLERSYFRSAARAMGGAANLTNWSAANENAECLYLIISTMQDGDKNGLDFFTSDEIGDIDEDGMKEILDAWGMPIVFLRWAPGYVSNPWDPSRGWTITTQMRPETTNIDSFTPDPFDPIKVDGRWSGAVTDYPFALRPLIVSAGRDKLYDIVTSDYDAGSNNTYVPTVYSATTPRPNDPYVVLTKAPGRRIGEPFAGSTGYADNITNHNLNPPSP